MISLVWVCIILTVVELASIYVGLLEGVGDVWKGGAIALFITVLFGFGIMCGAIEVEKKETILLPEEIMKGKYTLFVKVEGWEYTTTDARFVIPPENSIRIKKTINLNSYGKQISSNYELIINDGG